MKIGLQTWGSHGDVEPFMALAAGLVSAGHEVDLVVTTQGDSELTPPSGARLERVGRSMRQAEGDALIDRVVSLSSPMAQGSLILEEGFLPFADDMFEAAKGLAGRCDLIVRHHFLYMTQAAAELAGIPEVSVFLTPDLLPTRERPPTGMPSFGPLQKLAWWLANKGISSVFGPPAHDLRARVGLPDARDVLSDIWPSEVANLIAVSPTLFRRPTDWPPHHHLTGFWRAPSTAAGVIEAELDAFLDDGEPPVYATFGSMSGSTGDRRLESARLLVQASREAGRRLVLQTTGAVELIEEDVYVIEKAPHARVFGRCAAVVHHGGAGTTQTAVMAGTPSIVVPHLADQFFWAGQVEHLGLGVATSARAQVRPAGLARAIRAASVPGLRAKCQDMARSLVTEDGVARAVEAITAIGRNGI